MVIAANGCIFLLLRFHYFQTEAKDQAGHAISLLKTNEASLQSIMKTIPDIVFRLDIKGRIIYVSPSVRKYIKDPGLLLGKSIFSLVAPEDLDRAQFRLNERRTGERATRDLEIRLRFPKDQESTEEKDLFFSVSSQGIYQDNDPVAGSFLGTQGIVKDITDKKTA